MIRFYNGKVLAMNGGTEVTADEVWTDGAKICYVGPAKAEMPAFERQIDLKGNLLIPGFKNAHTHSAMTFWRALADDVPLQPWLFDQIFPLEAKLTPERVYAFTKLAILEYLTSGITAAFDMYYFRDMGAQACIDSGFRYVFCGLTDPPEAVEEDYLHFNALHPLISLIPGLHAEYTADEEKFRVVRELVQKYKAPFFTHNSETASEVADCIARRGMTPTEWFESLGLFDYGGGGYHCVHFSDHDIEIFKNRGLSVVTCPASNAKLASGIAPLQRYMDEGINLAIGTDGPASNNGLDMFREMYLVSALQKYKRNDAAAGDADRTLRMACVGGAHAMGLFDCDDLAVGKKADLTVIDMRQPNMQPPHNIAKNLVYSGSKSNIRLTMVNGKILYENGEYFIGEDQETIYQRVAAHSERLFHE